MVPDLWTTAVRAARAARADFGLDDRRPVADLLEVTEARAGLQVVVLALPGSLAGAYARRSTGPLVFVDSADPTVRQRFTLAHELGHHRLEHPTTVDDLATLTGLDADPVEVQANRFAAEFLMPRPGVQAWAREHLGGLPTLDDVVRLAAHFGVSAKAARIRLRTTFVLRDEDRIAALDREIDEHLHRERHDELGLPPCWDGLAEASAHPPRLPPAFARSLLGGLVAGTLTVAEAAAAGGRSEAEVRSALTELGLDALLPALR